MRIRSHFLSRIFLAAIISSQPVLNVQAQEHPHLNPYYHHAADTAKFKEQVQKLVGLAESSSDHLLEEVVNFANKMADYNDESKARGLTLTAIIQCNYFSIMTS